MYMKILSWNVRSLGGLRWKRRRGQIRQELSKELTSGQLDFLFIQEQRLKATQIEHYESLLKDDWETFWTVGYGPLENRERTCIAIRGPWKSFVINKVVFIPGRAQLLE